MMLIGENSLVVVERVKAKLAEIQGSLPVGVHIEPFYDRTDLVADTQGYVKHRLVVAGGTAALEHPHLLDLVRWMIELAAGDLPALDQLGQTLRPRGHGGCSFQCWLPLREAPALPEAM